jgi:transglutaminase-like putative cysteine protease
MRSAVRMVAVTAPALVVVAAAWLRLESPVGSLWDPVVLLALAVAAAALPRRSLRLVAAVVATLAAVRVVLGVSLMPGFGVAHGGSALGTRFDNGVSDFYSTHLPFDPRVHVAMADLVLAGIFAFALVAALLAAERMPVAAAVVVLLGAGWPATLLGPSHGFAMGAAILGAVLVMLAGLGSRRIPALAVPAVAVVAAGALAVGSATAARHGLVHWQTWNLANVASGPVGFGFVWDAQYGGLTWPAQPTVVLEVQSAQRPTYLRAAVLDDFIGDRWTLGLPRPADSLEPAAALRPRNQTRESVTVDGLADSRLVGGSIPIRFGVGGAPFEQPERGFASLDQNLPRGFQYTVWSYSPRPSVAQLRRSAPQYPAVIIREGDLLDVGRGVSMPPFGAADRAGTEEALLTVNPDLNPYVPLARLADQVAGGARTPYDAVARLENWFVSSGGFRYSNHPLEISPALVGFVTQTRAGYCQYFAGAMALMLRYLGIPARVAVGFGGGTWSPKGHGWIVTDRDAHAWVEVWFKGFGWLPFDPTPAVPGSTRQPTLAGSAATPAGGGTDGPSGSANGAGARRGSGAVANKLSRQNGFRRPHGATATRAVVATAGGGTDRRRALLFILLTAAVGVGGIVAAKAGARLLRSRYREPRRVAAACREERVAFLVDQRIEVPRSATLRELGELVRREFGADPGRFVEAATAARFGRSDPAVSRDARRELGLLLNAMRRGLTSRDRLRGLLSLRSLGRPPAAVPRSASLGSGMVGSGMVGSGMAESA